MMLARKFEDRMKHISIICFTIVTVVTCYRLDDKLAELDRPYKREIVKAVGDFRKLALDAHNELRAKHVDTPPMVWDENLAIGAQAYSAHLARTNKFEHSTDAAGENLYKGVGQHVRGFEIAAFLWYEEINKFNFDPSKMWKYNVWGAGKLGHFTQMVWAATTRVGCGGSHIRSGNSIHTLFACRYMEPGNVLGFFDENVKPLKPGITRPTSALELNFYKTAVSEGKSGGAVSSCVDANPDYCSIIEADWCDDDYDRKNCKKTCNLC